METGSQWFIPSRVTNTFEVLGSVHMFLHHVPAIQLLCAILLRSVSFSDVESFHLFAMLSLLYPCTIPHYAPDQISQIVHNLTGGDTNRKPIPIHDMMHVHVQVPREGIFYTLLFPPILSRPQCCRTSSIALVLAQAAPAPVPYILARQ